MVSSAWKYVVIYLLAIQVGLGFAIPDPWLYRHRVSYEVFKEDPRTIDLVLDRIAGKIRRERLHDYVVILGDSVGYSGPGGPEQSIGHAMEQLAEEAGQKITVFSLALPAMQIGDIYVVLLKLGQRGIATDRVVINLLHAGFVARKPSPPIAFWLADDLRRLDPESWERYRDHLVRNDRVPGVSISNLFDRYVAPHIALLAYRPVLQSRLSLLKPGGGEVYDTRPWYQKPELPGIVADPMYQLGFDPTPLDMSEQNPQIFFLNKILALTVGTRPLIYLTPTNQELMKANVTKQGYQENLTRIDAWFQDKPVRYVNLEDALDAGLFADHVHLTPEGYRHLAGILLENIER